MPAARPTNSRVQLFFRKAGLKPGGIKFLLTPKRLILLCKTAGACCLVSLVWRPPFGVHHGIKSKLSRNTYKGHLFVLLPPSFLGLKTVYLPSNLPKMGKF